MTEEEMKKAISKSAKHLLDNYDELIAPDIPKMAEDIKELINMTKSGKYSQEELLKIARDKADKLARRK